MYCKSCGAQIDEGAKFCNKCGASQLDSASQKQNGNYKEGVDTQHVHKNVDNVYADNKIPLLAAILSLVFAGLGQFYNGDNKKGVVFVSLEIIFLILAPTGISLLFYLIVCIYAVIDAWNVANGEKRIAMNWKEANKPWSY